MHVYDLIEPAQAASVSVDPTLGGAVACLNFLDRCRQVLRDMLPFKFHSSEGILVAFAVQQLGAVQAANQFLARAGRPRMRADTVAWW